MKHTELAKTETSAEAVLYRQSTNIAHLCKEIVVKSAVEIQGRKYVKVEGWMSIAVAHGCIASVLSVEEVAGGVKAVAEIRKQSDSTQLCTAEGFVGKDEPTWFGGEVIDRYGKKKTLPKRADYAIRAMAQTRAVSRACRTAFSHVVVLMDAGLQTVPAEEIGHDDSAPEYAGQFPPRTPPGEPLPEDKQPAAGDTQAQILSLRPQFEGGKWKEVAIHFGSTKGTKLADLGKAFGYWREWFPKAYGNKPIAAADISLRAALDVAAVEGLKAEATV